jgi:hypothetical protein
MSGEPAYEPSLPAHVERLPSHSEALPVVEASEDIPERVDRGTDWLLVFAILTPIVAAYAAIAYGVYAFVAAF